MKMIFLGLMYADVFMKSARKNSRCGMQMAPHNYQETLLEGIGKCTNVELNVLNVPPVGSFPKNYKSPVIKGMHWGNGRKQIGYINLPWLKRKIQKLKLKREIEKIIKNSNDEIGIVIYSPYEPFLEVISEVKKKNPCIRSCMIVTDCIPGRGDMDRYMTKKAVESGNRIVKMAKNVDCFALLTKYIAEALEIGDKPFEITECIANAEQPNCNMNKKSENRCLYTGTLDREFGICEMADAFSLIPEAELWICGGGNAREYVEKMAEKYNNIKYFGFLDKEELQKLRNECDFLINPRKPTGTYTKYSFPSKTAEYMVSGKPVIMYKLEGVPDEYDAYLNYIEADSAEKIADELKTIFAMDYQELTDKAQKGRKYMLEEKSAEKQAKKILSLLEGKY